jgi:hypothetical protein
VINEIKVLLQQKENDDEKSTDRDISIGFKKELNTEYTMMYSDRFTYKQYKCISMPLMSGSLQTFLEPLMKSPFKIYMNDDVHNLFNFYLLFILFRKWWNFFVKH